MSQFEKQHAADAKPAPRDRKPAPADRELSDSELETVAGGKLSEPPPPPPGGPGKKGM